MSGILAMTKDLTGCLSNWREQSVCEEWRRKWLCEAHLWEKCPSEPEHRAGRHFVKTRNRLLCSFLSCFLATLWSEEREPSPPLNSGLQKGCKCHTTFRWISIILNKVIRGIEEASRERRLHCSEDFQVIASFFHAFIPKTFTKGGWFLPR